MKARKKIPTFKDEDAEREFWSREDSHGIRRLVEGQPPDPAQSATFDAHPPLRTSGA
jgi:hypothetical protein